jgi:hypothetical protein
MYYESDSRGTDIPSYTLAGVGALVGSQIGSWFWGGCLGLVLGVLLT